MDTYSLYHCQNKCEPRSKNSPIPAGKKRLHAKRYSIRLCCHLFCLYWLARRRIWGLVNYVLKDSIRRFDLLYAAKMIVEPNIAYEAATCQCVVKIYVVYVMYVPTLVFLHWMCIRCFACVNLCDWSVCFAVYIQQYPYTETPILRVLSCSRGSCFLVFLTRCFAATVFLSSDPNPMRSDISGSWVGTSELKAKRPIISSM